MTRNINQTYERLIEDLSRDLDERYKEHLLENPRTIKRDNLIFDVENLDSYYRCEGCKKRKPKAFCCSNHDLELTRRDLKVVSRYLPRVAESFPELERVIGARDFWTLSEDFEKIMRQKRNGDCVFLMKDAAGCYLHRWALDNRVDPIEVKPYVCSLFPAVVVILGDDIVITTLNEESARVLDCGDSSVSCAAFSGRPEDHALRRSRNILTRMFGEKVYRDLAEKVLEKKG